MSKLTPYVNEIVSFIVMLLLLAAIVSGQLHAKELKLAAAIDAPAETSHIRLEDE